MDVNEFEVKKHSDNVRLKELELELKRIEIENRKSSILSSPLSVSVLVGLITLAGAILTGIQGYSAQLLEREKAENLLIQQFVEMAPNRSISRDNLVFLAEAGLLSKEKEKKLKQYLERARNGHLPIPTE